MFDIEHVLYIHTTFYQNDSAMRHTADVTGRCLIVVHLRVSAVNLSVTFYDIHRKKEQMSFFCSAQDTTRDVRC
jgi:hypothetical protein